MAPGGRSTPCRCRPDALTGVTTTGFGPAARARSAWPIGDALGMPTQGLPFALVQSRYGRSRPVRAGPRRQPDQPRDGRRPGHRRHRPGGHRRPASRRGRRPARPARAGPTAARLGGPDAGRRARSTCSARRPGARSPGSPRGSRPTESGRDGDTNGAAMRIAPRRHLLPGRRRRPTCRTWSPGSHEVSLVTHDTGLAIAGASAVAAAVSAGVAGLGLPAALELAADAARLGAAYGGYVAGRRRRRPDRLGGRRSSPGGQLGRGARAREPPGRHECGDPGGGARGVRARLADDRRRPVAGRPARPRASAATATRSPRWPGPICGAVAGVDAFPADARGPSWPALTRRLTSSRWPTHSLPYAAAGERVGPLVDQPDQRRARGRAGP